MPGIARVGDKSTGHDNCPSVEAVEGSKNVFANGKSVVLVGDKFAPHGCDKHKTHQGYLAEGSSSVFMNGKAVGRVGDKVSCGGTVAEGSNNVFIGNGNEQKLNKALCKRNEAVTRYKRRREDEIFFCLPLIADAMGNKANEQKHRMCEPRSGSEAKTTLFASDSECQAGRLTERYLNDRQGWHYLWDMFYKWLSGEANDKPQTNSSPFWVDIDWVLRYFPKEFLIVTFPVNAITQRAINSLNTILAREGYFEEQDKEFDFINTPWQEWEKLYYQRVDVEERHLVEIGIIAALGTFTFRFLPKGKIEYLGENKYKVTLEEIAIFVHDTFNFEGKQDYGYWSCENKDMSFTPSLFNKNYIG